MATLLELVFEVETDQLERAEESLDKLKDKVKDIANDIPGLKMVSGELNEAFGLLSKMTVGLEASFVGAAGAAAAAGIAFAAAGIALAFKYDEKIDQLDILAQKFGLSATQADLMSAAAKGAGSSLEAVEQVFAKVAAAAFKSTDLLKGTGAAFKALGVEINDASGHLKSTEEITSEAVNAWENGAQTTAEFAAAQKILGKSFLEQLPALKEVAEAKQRAMEYEQQGIGISEAGTKASSDHKKANQELAFVFDVMGSKLVGQVIPYFTELTKQFTESYKEGGMVKDIFVAMQYATEGLMIVIDGLVKEVKGVAEIFQIAGNAIGGYAAIIVEVLHGNFKAAADISADIGKTIVKGYKDGFDAIGELATRSFNLVNGKFEEHRQKLDELAKQRKSPYANAGGDHMPGKDPNDAIQKLIDSLQVQIDKTKELGAAQEAIDKLKEKQYAGASQSKKDEASAKMVELEREQANKSIRDLVTAMNLQEMTQQHLNESARIGAILDEAKHKHADETVKQTLREAAAKKDLIETENILYAGKIKMSTATDAYNKKIDDLIKLTTKSKYQLEEENQTFALQKTYIATLLDLQKKGELNTESATKANDDYNASLQQMTEKTKQQIDADQQFVARGVTAYKQGIGDMNDATSKFITSGLSSFESALDKLATTGKFNFKDFALSIVQDIEKMIIKFAVMIPLANAFQSAMGGGGGFMGMVSSFLGAHADGGPTAPGGTYLVGEKGPELWTAPGAGAIVPNAALGDGGGGNTVHFHNAITVNGASGSNAQENIAQARMISSMVDAQIKQSLVKESLPGGILSTAQRRY